MTSCFSAFSTWAFKPFPKPISDLSFKESWLLTSSFVFSWPKVLLDLKSWSMPPDFLLNWLSLLLWMEWREWVVPYWLCFIAIWRTYANLFDWFLALYWSMAFGSSFSSFLYVGVIVNFRDSYFFCGVLIVASLLLALKDSYLRSSMWPKVTSLWCFTSFLLLVWVNSFGNESFSLSDNFNLRDPASDPSAESRLIDNPVLLFKVSSTMSAGAFGTFTVCVRGRGWMPPKSWVADKPFFVFFDIPDILEPQIFFWSSYLAIYSDIKLSRNSLRFYVLTPTLIMISTSLVFSVIFSKAGYLIWNLLPWTM